MLNTVARNRKGISIYNVCQPIKSLFYSVIRYILGNSRDAGQVGPFRHTVSRDSTTSRSQAINNLTIRHKNTVGNHTLGKLTLVTKCTQKSVCQKSALIKKFHVPHVFDQ
jgi:hypothetical protein